MYRKPFLFLPPAIFQILSSRCNKLDWCGGVISFIDRDFYEFVIL